MAIKLASPRAELTVLRGLVHSKKVSGALLNLVDKSYFSSNEAKTIYEYVNDHVATHGDLPSFRLMVEDPSISRKAREFFRDSIPTITSVEDAVRAAKVLNRYRQSRGVHAIGTHIANKFGGDAVDVPKIIEEISEAIVTVGGSKNNAALVGHIGRSSNTAEDIEDILNGESSELVIPTGIRDFDEDNGGWLRGSLVSMGATSGAGKSAVALNVALNQAYKGYRVMFVPLEMSRQELECRALAAISGIDNTRILQRKLTENEKTYVKDRWTEWEYKVKKRKGRLSIYKPDDEVSVNDIFNVANVYRPDVLYIDYASLLKEADEDDAWKALGRVSRKSKLNAEATNRVNVLLVQINDEGKIRYARKIGEDSSSCWIWNAPHSERAKNVGKIKIEQFKSRNNNSKPFFIGMNWSHMKVVKASSVQEEKVGEVPHHASDI